MTTLTSKIDDLLEKNRIELKGKHLLCCVSGGADSICLLFLMKDILPADNIRVIHINHMIRGNEADEDSGFVEEICRREGLFFKEIRKDILLQ